MKRKGLVVSSIVMVVVLIASLTTATYAWFSATSVASIDGVSLVTQTSDALMIGLMDIGAKKTTITSGTLSRDGNGKFTGGSDGTSGILDLSTLEGGFLSASGDGRNFIAAHKGDVFGADNEGADGSVGSDDKPTKVCKASGKSAIILDTVIYNKDKIEDSNIGLTLKELKISMTATTAQAKFMAASTRIAILSSTAVEDPKTFKTEAEANIPTWTPVIMLEPYAYVSSASGNPTFGTKAKVHSVYAGAGVTDSTVVAYPTSDFADIYSAQGIWQNKYYVDASVDWWKANTLAYPGTASVNQIDVSNLNSVSESTTDGAGIVVGSFVKAIQGTGTTEKPQYASKNYVPVRICIWFEGEDPECVAQFAMGDGISVSMSFSTGAVA